MPNETAVQLESGACEPYTADGAQPDGSGADSSACAVAAVPLKGLADEQLVAMHEVAKSLANERSLGACLKLIAEKACRLTNSSSTALALLDDDRQMLDFAAVAGRSAREMAGQRVRVADALPGHTALTGEPLLAFNPALAAGAGQSAVDTAGAQDEERLLIGGAIRSAAVVPIFVDGNPVGSLAAINRTDGQSYAGSDLLMLHFLASSAACAVQKRRLVRQSAQQERERDLLYEAARATSSTLNVQEILDGVLATISRCVNSYAAIVFLLNDERTHLFIGAERGLTREDREVQLLAEGKLAAAALGAPGGSSFLIVDTLADPRYEAIWPEDHFRPLTLLVAPLISRDNAMGMVVVASHQRNAYGKDDVRLLSAVASQAAVALENAWLYEDATRRAEEATAIYELSQAVNTNLNLQRVLNFVADSVLALLHIDKFALFLHNPRTSALDIMVARNIRREVVQTMHPTRQNGGIAWWVYEFETPTAVQNVAADHRNRSCPIDREGVASLVSVPLQAGDEVIGVIHAMSSRRRLFTVAEMELLYTIANQVGVAISNIQMLEEARRRSAELRRSFRRVARAMGTSLDQSQSAQTIVDLAAEMMRAERTLLYSVEPLDKRLLVRAASGLRLPPDAQSAGRDIEVEHSSSAAWIARRGRSLVIEDPLRDTRFAPPAAVGASLMRCGAYLGVPLKIGNETMGVLEVYSRERRTFTTDQIRQFLAFAAQSAVALQNALLVEHADRRRADLQMLAALSAKLGEQSGRELLEGAIRLLIETTRADCGMIVDSCDGRIVEFAPGRESEDGHEGELLSAARQAAQTGEALRLGSGGEGDRAQGARPAVIASPIRSAGAISLLRAAQERPFDRNEEQLLQTVANLLDSKISAPH